MPQPDQSNTPDQAWLIIRGIDPALWSFHIAGAPQRVGRASDCEIRVIDPGVSREHAVIRHEADGWHVRDLGSHNGTFVNELRVTEATFEPGDALRFGTVTLDVVAALPERLRAGADYSTVAANQDHAAALGRLEEAAAATLSSAQRQVFGLLLQGLTEKQVARRLHLSFHTVHTHVKSIYRELGVQSRPELLARYWRDSGSRPGS